MYCPLVQSQGLTRAYEVTYSYYGQTLASDEHVDGFSTFRVYFTPEELRVAGLQALLSSHTGRVDSADFQLTISRVSEARPVIDDENSVLCEGNYVDGAWVQANAKCRDNLKLKSISVGSDYVRVRVDLTPPRATASQPGR